MTQGDQYFSLQLLLIKGKNYFLVICNIFKILDVFLNLFLIKIKFTPQQQLTVSILGLIDTAIFIHIICKYRSIWKFSYPQKLKLINTMIFIHIIYWYRGTCKSSRPRVKLSMVDTTIFMHAVFDSSIQERKRNLKRKERRESLRHWKGPHHCLSFLMDSNSMSKDCA